MRAKHGVQEEWCTAMDKDHLLGQVQAHKTLWAGLLGRLLNRHLDKKIEASRFRLKRETQSQWEA